MQGGKPLFESQQTDAKGKAERIDVSGGAGLKVLLLEALRQADERGLDLVSIRIAEAIDLLPPE